tara:strand:+ start:286 stop:915 length:630 start_codon:yes stop_codon:yes gene_type:complete
MGRTVNLYISRSPKSNLSSSSDDNALWQSLRKGNDLAFSNLYHKYSNLLFNYGMHFCSYRELVKDCIQELFTAIWTRRESLSDVESVKFYLFKSFRNLLIHHISRERKLFVDSNENQAPKEFEKSMEDLLIFQDVAIENKGRVALALSKISKRQREILILKYFNDLSYSEIASMMMITPASAHNLLSKALQCLRVIIKGMIFFAFFYCQ